MAAISTVDDVPAATDELSREEGWCGVLTWVPLLVERGAGASVRKLKGASEAAETVAAEAEAKQAAAEVARDEVQAQKDTAVVAIQARTEDSGRALESVVKKDIDELSRLRKPPKAVSELMGAVFALVDEAKIGMDWGKMAPHMRDLRKQLIDFDITTVKSRQIAYATTRMKGIGADDMKKRSGVAYEFTKWILAQLDIHGRLGELADAEARIAAAVDAVAAARGAYDRAKAAAENAQVALLPVELGASHEDAVREVLARERARVFPEDFVAGVAEAAAGVGTGVTEHAGLVDAWLRRGGDSALQLAFEVAVDAEGGFESGAVAVQADKEVAARARADAGTLASRLAGYDLAKAARLASGVRGRCFGVKGRDLYQRIQTLLEDEAVEDEAVAPTAELAARAWLKCVMEYADGVGRDAVLRAVHGGLAGAVLRVRAPVVLAVGARDAVFAQQATRRDGLAWVRVRGVGTTPVAVVAAEGAADPTGALSREALGRLAAVVVLPGAGTAAVEAVARACAKRRGGGDCVHVAVVAEGDGVRNLGERLRDAEAAAGAGGGGEERQALRAGRGFTAHVRTRGAEQQMLGRVVEYAVGGMRNRYAVRATPFGEVDGAEAVHTGVLYFDQRWVLSSVVERELRGQLADGEGMGEVRMLVNGTYCGARVALLDVAAGGVRVEYARVAPMRVGVWMEVHIPGEATSAVRVAEVLDQGRALAIEVEGTDTALVICDVAASLGPVGRFGDCALATGHPVVWDLLLTTKRGVAASADCFVPGVGEGLDSPTTLHTGIPYYCATKEALKAEAERLGNGLAGPDSVEPMVRYPEVTFRVMVMLVDEAQEKDAEWERLRVFATLAAEDRSKLYFVVERDAVTEESILTTCDDMVYEFENRDQMTTKGEPLHMYDLDVERGQLRMRGTD